uniref:EF-hand domain-containing protein n=1 Tax=Oryza nivara TaxID=4536 RepID=A0A0E0HNK6_ORYNI
MRAQRPSSAAAGNPVLALLFLWVLGWRHVTAEIDIGNMTALQKHVSFFDRNKDGIITPSETIEGD